MVYYPIVRFRGTLTQRYTEQEVRCGARGFATYEAAKTALDSTCTDDSDYEICVYVDGRWRAVRNGEIFWRNFV